MENNLKLIFLLGILIVIIYSTNIESFITKMKNSKLLPKPKPAKAYGKKPLKYVKSTIIKTTPKVQVSNSLFIPPGSRAAYYVPKKKINSQPLSPRQTKNKQKNNKPSSPKQTKNKQKNNQPLSPKQRTPKQPLSPKQTTPKQTPKQPLSPKQTTPKQTPTKKK